MARPALAAEQVERFQRRLCDLALRRFAEDGYAAVTLRGLAAELGCSYATPYRYFRNKEHIFAAVRALAYERFADALDAAATSAPDATARVRAMMEAYVRFAREQPQAYRIMFELGQPEGERYPGAGANERRAWEIWEGAIRRAVRARALAGDPSVVAHLLWAGVHGVVTLHLAGKLVLGQDCASLAGPMIDTLLAALGPRPRARR